MSSLSREIAPAKLNLALHVRGLMPDGRHAIETIFAFCADGDRLSAQVADEITLTLAGPFAGDLGDPRDNLVVRAASALAESANVRNGAAITLIKQLPVAAGIGGGSADAAAALRLLTGLWKIDPVHAETVAPQLGSDVPACLLSLPMRGEGAGDQLTPVDLSGLSGSPILLVNPRVPLSTAEVFRNWDLVDRGPLCDWREGRNDLQPFATALVPQIQSVLVWLASQPGATLARMSGSGATCFALFEDEQACKSAEQAAPDSWWRLGTVLR